MESGGWRLVVGKCGCVRVACGFVTASEAKLSVDMLTYVNLSWWHVEKLLE